MNEQVRVLFVDDEASILKAVQRIFMDTDYEILTAPSGEDGLLLFQQTSPVHVVVSDYRMPGMNGVDFLKEVCKMWPDAVRIVLSGYADTASIVEAINEGQIYKFIPKPWNDDELKVAIANAVERHFLHKKNTELNRELKEKNSELQKVNENLENLVRERTRELMFQNQVLKKSQNILNILPVAVVGIDPEGQIVLCNKAGAALFGRTILGMDRHESLSLEINALIDEVASLGSTTKRIALSNTMTKAKGMVMKLGEGQEGIVLVFDEDQAV